MLIMEKHLLTTENEPFLKGHKERLQTSLNNIKLYKWIHGV